jgi:hypothetical protein
LSLFYLDNKYKIQSSTTQRDNNEKIIN